jgi:hypothetical protein
MSNNNPSASTAQKDPKDPCNLPDEEWFKKADYRKVALERFDDAVALYHAERYEACFYMCGYVIEIGAKAKMAELAKTRFSDMTAPIVWRIIDELVYRNSSINIVSNADPLTIYDFCNYLCKMGTTLNPKTGKAPKALYNLLKEHSDHYEALTKGRVYHRDGEEKFHAPPKFLRTVGKWAKILKKEEDYYSEFENIASEFEQLGWRTSLRYGESQSNNPGENAEKALSIAYRFLVKSLLSDENVERAKYVALGEHLNLTSSSSEEIERTVNNEEDD